MSEIVMVRISDIKPNPMRSLGKYPYNPSKIAALRQSIRDVGLWEGVIARKIGKAIQVAFGHHRLHAAELELGANAKIPIIIRDLSDEDMLRFMGRENLEDYNADFLVMLESWEAATNFARRAAQNAEPIDIARVLGWIRQNHGSGTRMGEIAEACANAHKLIEQKFLEKDQLESLSVKDAREICQHIATQHSQVEKLAKKTGRPEKEVTQVKKLIAQAGGRVAKQVRKGNVAQSNIRGSIDIDAYEHAKQAKKQTPLFSQFIKRIAEGIASILKSDSYAEKLDQIKKNLHNIELKEDAQGVSNVSLECERLAKRAEKWSEAMTIPPKAIRAITKQKEASNA